VTQPIGFTAANLVSVGELGRARLDELRVA